MAVLPSATSLGPPVLQTHLAGCGKEAGHGTRATQASSSYLGSLLEPTPTFVLATTAFTITGFPSRTMDTGVLEGCPVLGLKE